MQLKIKDVKLWNPQSGGFMRILFVKQLPVWPLAEHQPESFQKLKYTYISDFNDRATIDPVREVDNYKV